MSTAIADIEYDLRAANLLINNDRSHHVRTSRNSINSTENGTTHVAIHCASELVHHSEHLRHVLLPSVEEEYVNLAVRERALTSRLTSARSRLQLLQSSCTLSKREEEKEKFDTCKERGGDGTESKRSSGSSNSSNSSSSVRSKILQLLVNDEIALLKWHQAKVEYETRRKRNVVPFAKEKKEKKSDDESNGGGHLLSQWFACFAEAGAKLELEESRRRNNVDVGTREKNATATTTDAMVAEKEVVEEVLDVDVDVVEVEVGGVERMMSGCQPAVKEEAAVVPPTIKEMVDMPCFMVRASTLQRGQKKGKKGTQQQQQQWSMQFRSRVKDTTVIVRLSEETKEVVDEVVEGTSVGAVRIRMEIEPREALATGKNVSSSHSMSASVWLSEHVPSVEATIMFVKEIVRPLLRVEVEVEELESERVSVSERE